MNPRQETINEYYIRGLFWIIRQRGQMGGWPPREITKVSGWTVVKMLAAMTNQSPRQVASDLIKNVEKMEAPHDYE